MTNIRKVAEKAGVSVSTVSRVLNGHPYVREDKRRIVLETIKALNYTQNANAVHLSRGKTNSIGVVLPYLNLPYYGEILQGIAEEALKAGYHLRLYQTNYEAHAELDAFEALRMKEVDGLIIASRTNSLEELKGFMEGDRPIVFCENLESDCLLSVYIDHYQAMDRALSYLQEKGYRKIGLCIHRLTGRNSEERMRAFREHPGTEVRDEWIFTGCYHIEDGRRVLGEWMNLKERPETLVVTSDQVAAGLLSEAGRKGVSIPKDLAFLSFDNHPISELMGITSFDVPSRSLGREAFRMFLREGRQRTVLQTTLFERGTV
ncbi:DNA-binding LacI/PurR family transcriptional regulator [Rossellomorea marisflavi]